MASPIVEQIIELKRKRGNTYPTDTSDALRVHIASNVDHFEYLEGTGGKVRAFIEWYEGRPIVDAEGRLTDIVKDDETIFIANIVANSMLEILKMGRNILRWCPKAKVLHFGDKYGRRLNYKIKDEWRKNG